MDFLKVTFLLLLFSGVVFADIDVNIFSPGRLSKAHKDLEGSKNCIQCHAKKGESLIQKDSCYKCHKAIKKRVNAHKGYHNQAINIEKKNCEDCHKEHFADRYDLITWPNKGGYKKFNHDLTGFKLNGAHKKIDCEKCHKKENIKDKSLFKDENVNIKTTYLGLDTNCVSCHLNDVHQEQIDNKNCANCHDETDFKNARISFNHNLTNFPLKGQHKTVNCEACHKPLKQIFYEDKWRYKLKHKGIKYKRCVDCHKNDDIHENVFGDNCERCHTESSFNDIIFDKKEHAVDKFPLTGKHLKEDCRSCHTDKLNIVPNESTCVSCHKKDDPHRRKFGETCEDCHNTTDFKDIDEKSFNHNLTGFKIEGYHKKLNCIECHSLKGDYKKKYLTYNKDNSCIKCHTSDNPHKDEFKDDDCSKCHNQDRFIPSEYSVEEHNKTDFKLDGSHEVVSCNQCHKPYHTDKSNGANKDGIVLTFHTEEKDCVDCHKNPHIKQFENYVIEGNKPTPQSLSISTSYPSQEGNNKVNCEKCHTTESFHKTIFDHNKDTDFKLINSHKDVTCERCHEYKKDKNHEFGGYFLYTQNKNKDCSYCHTDIHYGQFNDKKCSDCHTDVKWEDLSLFEHNRDTKFKIDGAHEKLECEDCHKTIKIKEKDVINYKIKKYSCIDCHDTYHKDGN